MFTCLGVCMCVCERACTSVFIRTAAEWDLTVSIEKTMGLDMGRHLQSSDKLPMQLDGGTIELLEDFTYLGSKITEDGEVRKEVETRIGKASRTFGCLQKSIFQNHRLAVRTKREVYRATVLSVLLYGMETLIIKSESERRLSGFHNRCIRSIMGVSKHQQWREHITSRQLAKAFGMEETMRSS